MGQRVIIPIFGGTYEGHEGGSQEWQANEASLNIIPQVDPEGIGKIQPGTLKRFPGTSEFSTVRNGAGVETCRGMITFEDQGDSYNEKVATIINTQFGITDSAGTTAVPTTISNAITADFGTVTMHLFQSGATSNVVWAPHGTAASGIGRYVSSTDTQDVVAVTGTGFANNSPNTISTMNRQILGEDGQSWATSAPGTESIDTTNRLAEAEAFPDRLLRSFSLNPYSYKFGSRSIEVYENTGTGKPPFRRIPSGVFNRGILNKNAIASWGDKIFFLDNQSNPVMMRGLQLVDIGNPFIKTEFRRFSLGGPFDDGSMGDIAIMPIFWEGQLMVVFKTIQWDSNSSPVKNQVYVWHETPNLWTQVGATLGTSQWGYAAYAYAFDKHLVMHESNGKMYELTPDEYQDAGTTMDMLRVTKNVTSEMLGGEPDQWVYYNRVVITALGGNFSGTNELKLSFSDDGGTSWATDLVADMDGNNANFNTDIYYAGLGRSRNRMWRITYDSIDSQMVFISMQAEVEFGAP